VSASTPLHRQRVTPSVGPCAATTTLVSPSVAPLTHGAVGRLGSRVVAQKSDPSQISDKGGVACTRVGVFGGRWHATPLHRRRLTPSVGPCAATTTLVSPSGAPLPHGAVGRLGSRFVAKIVTHLKAQIRAGLPALGSECSPCHTIAQATSYTFNGFMCSYDDIGFAFQCSVAPFVRVFT
jgi:hypothetical protein